MIPDRCLAGGHRTVPALAMALCLSGCLGADTTGDPMAHTWVLQSLDGAPFRADATLDFPNSGRIEGAAPCNRYSATLETALPDFALGPILSTRRACPDLALESAYFRALNAMERVESHGRTLTLIGPDGRDMVFTAAD